MTKIPDDDWLRREWIRLQLRSPQPGMFQSRRGMWGVILIWIALSAAVVGIIYGLAEGVRAARGAEPPIIVRWHAPDPILTPGDARTTNPAAVCARPLPPRPSRGAWMGLKYAAMQEYHLDWSTRNGYELDHLIPRELGGADTLANLWPEPLAEARRKNKLENAMTRDFCRNDRSDDGLAAAQHWFATGGWAK